MQNSWDIDLLESFILESLFNDPVTQRILIFEKVRDFLYQMNWSNTTDKLLATREWYCVSKHRLLKDVYIRLWYNSKLCFVPFSFNMVYLPEHLIGWWLAVKKWYHTFLKVLIGNERINIEATYWKNLKEYYLVNENRDWVSSQRLITNDTNVFIASTDEEEISIKKALSDPDWFSKDDFDWISKCNERIRKVSNENQLDI